MPKPRRLEVVDDAFPGEDQEPIENFRGPADEHTPPGTPIAPGPDPDDLLPGMPSGIAVGPVDEDEDEDEDEDPEPVTYVADGSEPQPAVPDGYANVRCPATLQDAKVSAASNGSNYDLTFEIGEEGWQTLSHAFASGKGGYDATWHQVHIGQGAEVRSLSAARDADGQAHFKLRLRLPASEIARSLGRLGAMLKQHSVIVLDPMQGTLGLRDGTQVDLTKRAQ